MEYKIVTFGEILLRWSKDHCFRIGQGNQYNGNFGGSEANVAVSLSLLGDSVEYVSRIPRSQIGQACVNALRNYGIDTRHVEWGGERLGTYYFEASAAMRNSKVVYDRNGSSFYSCAPGMFPWREIFKDVQLFHCSGITCSVSQSAADATFEETSVNKAGEGTLTLNTLNTYTGATVLHEGTLAFNTLKNGGVASAIGQSVNFAQNWVMDGGTYRYTGGTTSTDRSAKLSGSTVFEIADAKATVTMNGVIEGTSAANNFILDGNGQLTVGTSKFFGYTGQTILRGGILYLSTTDISKAGIGSSMRLVMEGGHLKTKGESNGYETYSFPILLREGTVSQFSPNRNCYLKNKLLGAGTLQLNIPYLREYVDWDMTSFTGKIIANGISSEKEGSLFLLEKGRNDLSNCVVETKGNARVCAWDTNGNVTLGGLSGASGTYLSGSSKNTKNFSCTWNVGTANTNETFAGTINNWS